MLQHEPNQVVKEGEKDREHESPKRVPCYLFRIEHHIDGYYADRHVNEIWPVEQHKDRQNGIYP